MTVRLETDSIPPAAVHAMLGVEQYVRRGGLEPALDKLVKIRASYINGCAYCVDLHTKDARTAGESERRLHAIPVWRETPLFTPRERAALAWTEAVTDIAATGVPDAEFAEARAHFTEEELVTLTMAIVAINGWNRLAVSFRVEPGTSKVPARRDAPNAAA